MRKKRSVLALLLSAALLATGPALPFEIYASVYEDDDEDDYDDVVEVDDDDDTVDEPSNSVDATIQKLESEISAVNSQLKDYQNQQKAIESKIADAKTEKLKAEATRNSFGDKIYLTEQEISSLQQKIVLQEEKILHQIENIEIKQGELDDYYELFKTRLRARYMQDNGTTLGLLLGSDSFSDFLTRTEFMVRVAKHDQQLMETLTEEREALEAEKAALEDEKDNLEANKTVTEEKKKDLAVQYNQAAMQVHDLDQMEQAFMADLEKNKAIQAAMKAEIDKLYKEIEFSKNPYVGGEMAWPLPGHTTISSYYGPRFGGSDYHTGTDITGPGCLGSTIVAANDGQVVFVNTSYVQGSGYGIYVMLDHGVNDAGQSVSTLYAHCNAILVSTGQQVKKGDPIAQCGSTGWSTGPHLHFEVRLNGKHVNSLPYITK